MAVPRGGVPGSNVPLLIPASRDPSDTRPDVSGRIPAVHYNAPMYQRLPTQGHDPLVGALVNTLTAGAYNHPEQTRPYWRGVAQQFNPTTLSGAVNLASNFFPGNLHSGLVPKELSSSVPGITITRASKPARVRNWQGYVEPFGRHPDDPAGLNKGGATIAYNARDAKGSIVGSIYGALGKNSTYVESVYVHPDYRHTTLAHDLLAPVLQRGKPVHATVVNEKLGAIVRRLMQKNPNLAAIYAPERKGA